MLRATHDPAPNLTDNEVEILARRAPVAFLVAFKAMMGEGRRAEIGFDHEALAWIARVWSESALAAVSNARLRDACTHEYERYSALCNGLKRDMHERQDHGLVFLNEPADWPHPAVINGAIRALQKAGIVTIH